KVGANVYGNTEKRIYSLGASFRSAEDYDAATGSFGDITLEQNVPVNDSGLDDDSYNAYLGFRPSDKHTFFLRANRYRADTTGFGFVDPAAIGDTSGALIQITYPFQDFDRTTLGYEASALESAIATTVDLQLYQQENERQLANDIFIDIGPIFGFGPSSDIEINSLNFTNL
ncbi:MAG: hypothetical protein GY708_28585, partial [Actinomycetia bacterium]|nr:hypothetical protein [Actinomycetes bacterium]